MAVQQPMCFVSDVDSLLPHFGSVLVAAHKPVDHKAFTSGAAVE